MNPGKKTNVRTGAKVSNLICLPIGMVAVFLCPCAKAVATEINLGPYKSIQVNTDAQGQNIVGDLGNEPTLAQSPVNPDNIVFGWRLREPGDNLISAGNAYSFNKGQTWTNNPVLPATHNAAFPQNQRQKRTDPALDVDSQGVFYYQSYAIGPIVPNPSNPSSTTELNSTWVFKSIDGGKTWADPVYQFSGDRNFLAVDRTGGIGDGNIYSTWSLDSNIGYYAPIYNPTYFVRSTDHGLSYQQPLQAMPGDTKFGRMTVGPDGSVYSSGWSSTSETSSAGVVFYDGFYVQKSENAQNPNISPTFTAKKVDLGGYSITLSAFSPNPNGGISEVQILTDHSQSQLRGNIYMLANVIPGNGTTCDPEDLFSCLSNQDYMDIHFVRSSDGGETWSAPVRINDDPPKKSSVQWFPMMGVAPNSRIDAVWYDTRSGTGTSRNELSQLYYSYSWDGGVTWSTNQPVTPLFNTFIPYTSNNLQKDKMGDYAQVVSDETGGHVAYTATFNGEQDVYYLNVFPDCNGNGKSDVHDIATRQSGDINANHLPDSCESIVIPGDLDGDKDVDQLDVNILLAARNKTASAGNDPRDLDGNGVINLLDSRKQTLLCTRPRCATSI